MVQLLEEEERKIIAEELGIEGGQDRVISTLDDDDATEVTEDEESVETNAISQQITGYLPANRVYSALKGAKHLRLSRVQLLAVMSLASVEETSTEEIYYLDCVDTSAEMIQKFYEPRDVNRRTFLEKRTDINPLKHCKEIGQEELKTGIPEPP